jgi:SAM-dependent methyltransferase
MSDPFADVVRLHRAYLRDATLHALHLLGALQPLTQAPCTAPHLADLLHLPQPRRLAAALQALAAEGLLTTRPDLNGLTTYRWNEAHTLPTSSPPRGLLPGWGQLADVLRHDQPVDLSLPDRPDLLLRYHDHLARIAEPLAEALAPRLHATHLLDLGGGLGGYTLPWLDAHANGRATLLDAPEVIQLAARARLDATPRLTLRAADLLNHDLPTDADLILLSNVLHLLAPDDACRLLQRAADALLPGGRLLLRELDLDPEGLKPLTSAWFHLNMAIFTESGAVHPPEALHAWMLQAGLTSIERWSFHEAPEALVLIGTSKRETPT